MIAGGGGKGRGGATAGVAGYGLQPSIPKGGEGSGGSSGDIAAEGG